jgi:hypothetical protein
MSCGLVQRFMVFPQKIEGPVLVRNRKRLRSLDTPNLQFPRISGFIYLPGNYTRKTFFQPFQILPKCGQSPADRCP